MQITYEVDIEYDDEYKGEVPNETDIEDAIRRGLPDKLGGEIKSIYAEEL